MAFTVQDFPDLLVRDDVVARAVEASANEWLVWRYERRAAAYFGSMVRRLRVVDWSDLADMLDDAEDQGRIVEAERRDVLQSDLVVSGQRRTDREPVYLVVEVSAGIGADDVRRAADRASVLAKLGRPAIPVVAGQRIDPEPAGLASAHGVWQVLDGHVLAPEGAA